MHTLRKMQLFDYLNYIFLIGFSCLMLYPLLYVFSISVSDGEAVWRQSVKLFPIGFNLEPYEAIARSNSVLRAYRNSITYTVLGTAFTLIACLLAAYPLSEPRFRLRGPISLILGLTLFFSAGLIPTYLTYQSYGLLNTTWVIVLPVAFNFWFIILVRANISTIPRELKDAARVDGASDFRILLQIIVPLSKPILATIALFVAVAVWNDFFNPLLYLNNSEKFPLTIMLRRMLIRGATGEVVQGNYSDTLQAKSFFRQVKMATVIVTTAPILLVYPFVQKYFVRGTLVGAIKG